MFLHLSGRLHPDRIRISTRIGKYFRIFIIGRCDVEAISQPQGQDNQDGEKAFVVRDPSENSCQSLLLVKQDSRQVSIAGNKAVAVLSQFDDRLPMPSPWFQAVTNPLHRFDLNPRRS